MVFVRIFEKLGGRATCDLNARLTPPGLEGSNGTRATNAQ